VRSFAAVVNRPGLQTRAGDLLLSNRQSGRCESLTFRAPAAPCKICRYSNLVLPATLVFVPRRYWLAVAGSLFAASAVFCFVLVSAHPDAAFYLLPARAWELGIGSLAALTAVDASRRVQFLLSGLFWLDGTFVYRDAAHFSYDGARRVAEKIGLGQLLQSVAR